MRVQRKCYAWIFITACMWDASKSEYFISQSRVRGFYPDYINTWQCCSGTHILLLYYRCACFLKSGKSKKKNGSKLLYFSFLYTFYVSNNIIKLFLYHKIYYHNQTLQVAEPAVIFILFPWIQVLVRKPCILDKVSAPKLHTIQVFLAQTNCKHHCVPGNHIWSMNELKGFMFMLFNLPTFYLSVWQRHYTE